MKTTVYFYMRSQPKDYKTFDTLAEAIAFMSVLEDNPECECYGIERKK